jgi:hypothetical protein
MPGPNDPSLVAKALSKAQAVESRLNALVGNQGQPFVVYNPSVTVVTQNVAGSYTWTCPAGVTVVQVQCWGAGGGGDGGNATTGAAGGGGGAYAEETFYPVVPGTVYSYVVGDGGDGALSNAGQGCPGGPSYFDLGGVSGGPGVFANGGGAGVSLVGGTGGAATPGQLISWAGGNGGGDGTQSTGGCGGGSSASTVSNGNNGAKSASGTGGAGGADTHGANQGAGGNGGNSGATGSDGNSPGAGSGGVGASSVPAGLVIENYNPTASATYYGSDAIGGNANNKDAAVGAVMWQGGTGTSDGLYAGTLKSVMILPSSVQSDLSGVTVDNVLLTVSNVSTYYSAGVTVALGFAAFTALPATFDGVTGVTSALTFTAPQGAVHVQQASDPLAVPLGSGTAKALVFGPGPNLLDLTYYGSFAGAGQSGAPLLTVVGHTGSAPIHSGDGSDGQVQVTYVTNGAAIGAMQPAAGSDAAGNAFSSGFSGQVSAFVPGSNPRQLEVPNAASFVNSWTGSLQYKMLPFNCVMISGQVTPPGGVANPSNVNTALSTSYRPNSTQYLNAVEDPGGAHLGQALICQMQTSGQIQVFDATAGEAIRIFGIYPLDFLCVPTLRKGADDGPVHRSLQCGTGHPERDRGRPQRPGRPDRCRQLLRVAVRAIRWRPSGREHFHGRHRVHAVHGRGPERFRQHLPRPGAGRELRASLPVRELIHRSNRRAVEEQPRLRTPSSRQRHEGRSAAAHITV